MSTRISTGPARVVLVAAAVLFSAVGADHATAHSFYDPECCGEQDCEPIPLASITFLGDRTIRMRDSRGVDWHVTIDTSAPQARPPTGMQGTPYEVTEAWRRFFEAQMNATSPMLKVSPDGAYHLCIYANRVHCVYLPAGG